MEIYMPSQYQYPIMSRMIFLGALLAVLCICGVSAEPLDLEDIREFEPELEEMVLSFESSSSGSNVGDPEISEDVSDGSAPSSNSERPRRIISGGGEEVSQLGFMAYLLEGVGSVLNGIAYYLQQLMSVAAAAV